MRLVWLFWALIALSVIMLSYVESKPLATLPESASSKNTVQVVRSEEESVRYSIADSTESESEESLIDSDNSKTEADSSRTESETQTSTETKPDSTSSFREQSRQAFERLNSGTYVEPVLRPDEQRKIFWLDQHRHLKEERRKSKQLPGRKQVLTLTTADRLHLNQTCKGDLFKHKVRMAGCEPKVIINRFCHGSCSSFYIPKLRSKKLKATFRSCAACVPVETDYVKVKLDCPQRPEKEMFRTVVRVKRCACRNIELDEGNGEEDDSY